MKYSISEIKEKAAPIALKFGIKSLSLFGSYARGEANDNSDVDFYIDKGKLNSLIRYNMFVEELEKELGCHVDVVTNGIRDEAFLSSIESEGIVLYEDSVSSMK